MARIKSGITKLSNWTPNSSAMDLICENLTNKKNLITKWSDTVRLPHYFMYEKTKINFIQIDNIHRLYSSCSSIYPHQSVLHYATDFDKKRGICLSTGLKPYSISDVTWFFSVCWVYVVDFGSVSSPKVNQLKKLHRFVKCACDMDFRIGFAMPDTLGIVNSTLRDIWSITAYNISSVSLVAFQPINLITVRHIACATVDLFKIQSNVKMSAQCLAADGDYGTAWKW